MSRGLGDEEQLEKEAEKSGDEQRTRRLRMAEGKRRFQEEGTLIHADVWQKPAHHYKTSKNKLKKKKPENLE